MKVTLEVNLHRICKGLRTEIGQIMQSPYQVASENESAIPEFATAGPSQSAVST